MPTNIVSQPAARRAQVFMVLLSCSFWNTSWKQTPLHAACFSVSFKILLIPMYYKQITANSILGVQILLYKMQQLILQGLFAQYHSPLQ